MTAAELLTAARDLYASAPSHAAPKDDVEEGTHCVVTAVYTSCTDMATYREAMSALRDSVQDATVIHYNASHTTEEVVAVFNRAIQSVQS